MSQSPHHKLHYQTVQFLTPPGRQRHASEKETPGPGGKDRPVLVVVQSLKLMCIESVTPSNQLILCHPLFFPLSIFPSISVFSNESVLHIRWPKYWSFSFSISPNEYSRLIFFRIDWFDLLAVQETLRAFWLSAFFIGYKCSTLHNDAKLSYTMMIPVHIPASSV